MEKLRNKIRNEAYIIDNRIVKVDHFINHMLDTSLVMEIGKEFADRFPDATKILTIESSGIAFAVTTAINLGNIPIVFARKSDSIVMGNHVYKREVYSYTKEVIKEVVVDKAFLSHTDKVVIIDDFLATGNALIGLSEIVEDSGAELLGCGIVIEKGFQQGRLRLEERNIKVISLANIIKIKNERVYFDE